MTEREKRRSPELIQKICNALGINKEWLLTGKGEMFFKKVVFPNNLKRKKPPIVLPKSLDLRKLSGRVILARAEVKLSQRELARIIGCSQLVLQKIETGRHESVRNLDNRLKKIAQACKVSFVFFKDGIHNQS